jgi:hypothetical protein
MDQEKLDKQVSNMLEEYVSEVDVPEAIEYIEVLISFFFHIVLLFETLLIIFDSLSLSLSLSPLSLFLSTFNNRSKLIF